jgi:LEA14-like dessication related protein
MKQASGIKENFKHLKRTEESTVREYLKPQKKQGDMLICKEKIEMHML